MAWFEATKRETFDIHQILLKLKFTSLSLLLSLICLQLTISFGGFAHKSTWQWFGGVFWGVCFRTLRAVVSRFWHSFRLLRPLKSGLVILTDLRKHWESFSSKVKLYEGKRQELAKPKSIFTTSRQRSSSSYWSCVTFVSYTVGRSLFSTKCWSLESNLMSSGLRNSAQGTWMRRARSSFMYTRAPVKGKTRHHLKSCWGQKNRFKTCSTTNDLAKGLSPRSMQKQRSKSNRKQLENAFCVGLFAIQNDCVARKYQFSVPLTNPDNN